MRKITSVCAMVILMTSVITIGTAAAIETVTAEEAFDAYANQVDPLYGTPAHVVIVDIRTTAEFYWVGACAEVIGIWTVSDPDTEDPDYVPGNGKVKLNAVAGILRFDMDGHPMALNVKKVNKIKTSPIAENIPYYTWDDAACKKVKNENFSDEIEALATDYNVIILMCRSGKRTTECTFDTNLFDAVYEIDHPDKNGCGGFQGTSYDDTYNGFRGFPGRDTSDQDYESVSWSDAGLPVHIGWCDGD